MKFILRIFVVMASLTGLLVASDNASVPVAGDARQPLNIGFALYAKGEAPGTLNARWNWANAYSGHGLATGGPKEGFSGRYHIRYYYENGEFSDEYDLVIEKAGDFYNVSWIANGKVSARGVGMEVEHCLAVGWRNVRD
ncbi:MAG: hypothetical protein JSR48_08140 [Verrucomicrobia bacterium]|nr:hypothetical protein [Verrucomicrobiota bacterium]